MIIIEDLMEGSPGINKKIISNYWKIFSLHLLIRRFGGSSLLFQGSMKEACNIFLSLSSIATSEQFQTYLGNDSISKENLLELNTFSKNKSYLDPQKIFQRKNNSNILKNVI